MKSRNLLYLFSLVVFLITSLACYSEYSNPLDLKYAEKIFGKKKLNIKEFSEGNYKIRSSMAVDIILSKYYIGKLLSDVKKELGKHDGYFQNDAIPAYLLSSKDSNPIWQLVFIPDEKWEKVKKVEIQKN